jgi:C4-dicarboxylate-specific signal transduction histidine kinase
MITSAIVSILLFGTLLYLLKEANDEFQQIYSVEFPLLQTVSTSVRLTDQSKDLLNILVVSKNKNAELIAEYVSVKEGLLQSLKDVETYQRKSRLKNLDAELGDLNSVFDADLQVLNHLAQSEMDSAKNEYFNVLLPKLENFREKLAQVAFLLSTQNEKKLEDNRRRFYYYSLGTLIGLIIAAFLWIQIFYMYRKSVAERAQAEKELEVQRARNIHNSKLSALGEMAGGVAHEINTPLATIRMTAENCEYMLETGELNKDVVAQSVARIIKTVDRIAKIVLSLKTFSRDGSNDKFENVSAKRILDEVLSFSAERFKSNEIEVIADVDDIEIYCQQIQIEQVLLNLLNNAFDAVKSVDKKWIRISGKPDANMLKISVFDSGEKIPADVEQKLMSPFFTTKEIGKGTGLGLSVSLGIARRHGGNLFYDGNQENTCFVLTLPLKDSGKKTG